MRGLKRDFESFAPKLKESHLLQMRGLKQTKEEAEKEAEMSHLLQMRGLKQALSQRNTAQICRIFYRCVD